MDTQDVQDSGPDLILCILSIHVEYSFFSWILLDGSSGTGARLGEALG
jgi:hypothetical protein